MNKEINFLDRLGSIPILDQQRITLTVDGKETPFYRLSPKG